MPVKSGGARSVWRKKTGKLQHNDVARLSCLAGPACRLDESGLCDFFHFFFHDFFRFMHQDSDLISVSASNYSPPKDLIPQPLTFTYVRYVHMYVLYIFYHLQVSSFMSSSAQC